MPKIAPNLCQRNCQNVEKVRYVIRAECIFEIGSKGNPGDFVKRLLPSLSKETTGKVNQTDDIKRHSDRYQIIEKKRKVNGQISQLNLLIFLIFPYLSYLTGIAWRTE